MAEAANDDALQSLPRLIELLRTIALGLAPDRSDAVLYSAHRSTLLTSSYRELMPGFMIQCISVFKFRDFISLYDPSPAMRERFIDASFGDCRARYNQEHGTNRIRSAAQSGSRWEL